MQYSLGISPELRSNFDYVFLLGENGVSDRKKLYEHYGHMFKTKDLFEQVFMKMTENYGCMVINNRARTSDLTKKVFWYKAQPRNDFKLNLKSNEQLHKFLKCKSSQCASEPSICIDLKTQLETKKIELDISEIHMKERNQQITTLVEENEYFEDEIDILNDQLKESKKCNSILMTVLPVAVSTMTFGLTYLFALLVE